MELFPCPECSRQISRKASACPQCGFPVNPVKASEPVEPPSCHTSNKKAGPFKIAVLTSMLAVIGLAAVQISRFLYMASHTPYLDMGLMGMRPHGIWVANYHLLMLARPITSLVILFAGFTLILAAALYLVRAVVRLIRT